MEYEDKDKIEKSPVEANDTKVDSSNRAQSTQDNVPELQPSFETITEGQSGISLDSLRRALDQ